VTTSPDTITLSTDILIIGAGAAGMSAAIAADEQGADTLLVDRSLIGRGGATVMAQMTVAVALGEEEPDDWQAHYADTIKAGRGLCNAKLAEILCRHGAEEIRRLDSWHVGWARHKDGRVKAAQAPGHDRPRCVYVDFLSTGPAVSRALRGQVQRQERIKRVGDLCITEILVRGGKAIGAVGVSMSDGRSVAIAAKTVIIGTGGLTRLYARNSASANMNGDGYALALRAGAELVDMEFVQFFPIGHLAPRMIGMDPIMWDPFRYKLGGRLLNAEMKEFAAAYGVPEDGRYVTPRDMLTHAIFKEVEAGRGSPAGGVFLSFQHVPADKLREAFGPVIDRLAKNGIDLTKQPIEVAPIAHYHMGGVRVAPSFETSIGNLFAAGEAIGGANGANRLSGNAITEALVFGRLAGLACAERARGMTTPDIASEAKPAVSLVAASGPAAVNTAAILNELQQIMARDVGPFRTGEGLQRALTEIARLRQAIGATPPGTPHNFDLARLDWFDLRNALLVAEVVASAALARTESRGAHQRYDFTETDETAWRVNQVIRLEKDRLAITRVAVPEAETAEAAQ
jgi:succinate dehydrogenase / fumarate reductase, flavoprotein subunit